MFLFILEHNNFYKTRLFPIYMYGKRVPVGEELKIMYGENNMFLKHAGHLHNLTAMGGRIHARSTDKCFEEITDRFENSGYALEEKLRMLSVLSPIFGEITDILPHSPCQDTAKAVKKSVDNLPKEEQTKIMYILANRALEALDPRGRIPRYET